MADTARTLLRDTAVWLGHWRADADCNLPPTRDSIDDLANRIDRYLASDHRTVPIVAVITDRDAPPALAAE